MTVESRVQNSVCPIRFGVKFTFSFTTVVDTEIEVHRPALCPIYKQYSCIMVCDHLSLKHRDQSIFCSQGSGPVSDRHVPLSSFSLSPLDILTTPRLLQSLLILNLDKSLEAVVGPPARKPWSSQVRLCISQVSALWDRDRSTRCLVYPASFPIGEIFIREWKGRAFHLLLPYSPL